MANPTLSYFVQEIAKTWQGAKIRFTKIISNPALSKSDVYAIKLLGFPDFVLKGVSGQKDLSLQKCPILLNMKI